MAAYDTGAFLDAVIGLVSGLSGIGEVFKGAPAAVTERVSAYVTVGPQRLELTAANGPRGGVIVKWPYCFVMFAYRITAAGPVAAAEDEIAGYIDDLVIALFADRTLGGVVQDVTIDLDVAREPDYQVRAGREFREWPCLISGKQQRTFT